MQMVSRVSPRQPINVRVTSHSPSRSMPGSQTSHLHAQHHLIQKLSVPHEYELHVYQPFIKMTWDKIALFLLQLSWTVQHVTAIHRHDIYPYGMFDGDAILQEGDDETSKVITLTKPMYFYEASFTNLY
ncbi:hypothetical protein M9458_034469, partial [Cirrhinus mrigala]